MRAGRLGNLEMRASDDGGIVIRHHGASSEGVEIQRADVDDVIAFMQRRPCVCEHPVVDPANILKCQLCARGIEGIDRWNYAAGRLVKQQDGSRRKVECEQAVEPRCVCGHLKRTHGPGGTICGDCNKSEWACNRFIEACRVMLNDESWCSLPIGHEGDHVIDGWRWVLAKRPSVTPASVTPQAECGHAACGWRCSQPADLAWPDRVRSWSDKGIASCGYCGERFVDGARIRSYGSGWAHVACVGERP